MENYFIIIYGILNFLIIFCCCFGCRKVIRERNRRINQRVQELNEIVIYTPPPIINQNQPNYYSPYQSYPTMVIMPQATAPPIDNYKNNEDPI
jgi:hypothetical protein